MGEAISGECTDRFNGLSSTLERLLLMIKGNGVKGIVSRLEDVEQSIIDPDKLKMELRAEFRDATDKLVTKDEFEEKLNSVATVETLKILEINIQKYIMTTFAPRGPDSKKKWELKKIVRTGLVTLFAAAIGSGPQWIAAINAVLKG